MHENLPQSHNVATSTVHNFRIARIPGFDGNYKAMEFHTLAAEFLEGAIKIGGNSSAVHYVLLIHAVELALKGFLHEKGFTLDQLLERGHDLNRLLEDSRSKGLGVSNPDTDVILSRLNDGGKKARIRYEFQFSMPLHQDVISVVQALLRATQPPIPGAT
jgi:hypothetical protein